MPSADLGESESAGSWDLSGLLSQRPSLQVAVTMRKERLTGAAARWLDWRWKLHDVVPDDGAFGQQPRKIHENDQGAHWQFPAMTVELFKDDAEGCYLNASTQRPGWFVLWRMEEALQLSDELIAVPHGVSLSYHDAGRWLDAQENVEQVPCQAAVAQWLAAFAAKHFVAEPKKRQRPESFKQLQDRFGKPASISSGQKYSGLQANSGLIPTQTSTSNPINADRGNSRGAD